MSEPPKGRRSASLAQVWQNAGMLVVFVFMFTVLSLTVDAFFTWRNMLGLTVLVSMVGMVACTMLFCLASGDFDLSVESVVAFSGVLAAVVIQQTHSVLLGIACGILGGGVVGLVNGVVIAKLKINALIATLATWQIVKGLAFIVSKGQAVSIPEESFFLLGLAPKDVLERWGVTAPGWLTTTILSVPNPVWITALCFVVFGFLLNRTTYGRNTLAIGGNKEAARLAGIAVDRIKITIFVVQGLMAGFAGVVLASRMNSGQPNTAIGFSLDVISACVLGGVALTGGVGTITGTLVGVLIMGTVQNAMALLNIDYFYRWVASGVILLAAVLFDQFKRRRTG